MNYYGFSKAWTVTGLRRDLRSLSIHGSQPHNMAHGPSVVPPSTASLLWEAVPIRHRRRCFPVSGCSGSLSPSWKYLCTTAVPQLSLTELGYQSRQISPCQVSLCRQAMARGSLTCCTSPMEEGRRAHNSCVCCGRHLTDATCHQGAVGAAHSVDFQGFLKSCLLFLFSTMYLKHPISKSPGQLFQCPVWVQDALFSV